MNLTLKKRKQIRSELIKKIPEVQKALELKKEIVNRLITESLSLLTEEEKWLFENYPELIQLQFKFSKSDPNYYARNKHNSLIISGNDTVFEKVYNRDRRCYYYGNLNEYNSEEIFNMGEIYLIDIPNNFPKIFNKEDLSDFGEIFNKEVTDWFAKNIKIFNTYLMEAEKKLSKIEKILSSEMINLIDIKKNCPGLYNVIKSIQ